MATLSLFSPHIIIIAIIAIILLARIINASKKELKFKQYTGGPAHQRYTPQFSSQMELDLRLPYRQFKRLYPNNNITYDEYKKDANQRFIQTITKVLLLNKLYSFLIVW